MHTVYIMIKKMDIKCFNLAVEMSAIKHRQLGAAAMAGDSDENYSDDESTPLTHDIYGGRYLSNV